MSKPIKELTNQELLEHIQNWNKSFVEWNNQLSKTNLYIGPELMDVIDHILFDVHYLLGLQIEIMKRKADKDYV